MSEWFKCEIGAFEGFQKKTRATARHQFFMFLEKTIWKRGRAVEGNSLENCHGATHQEFESLRFLKNLIKEIS